jgi:enoyl-CoA hydratase/carnithine racemase
MSDHLGPRRGVRILAIELDAGGSPRASSWDQLLARSLAQAAADPRIKALVLVVRTTPGVGATAAAGEALEALAGRLAWTVREAPLPLVMAFQGALSGAACLLALMVDALVADRGGSLIHPFKQTGLAEAGGSTARLAGMIGGARAREFILLGEPLAVRTAQDWGLLRETRPGEALVDAAVRAASELVGDWNGVCATRRSRFGCRAPEAGRA